MAGDPGHVVADRVEVAVGDGGVGGHPAGDLPVGRAVGRPRRVRLLQGLVLVGDGPPGDPRQLLGDLGHGQGLRPGHVVGPPVVPAAVPQQHGHGHVGDVVTRHRGHPPVGGRSPDDPVGPDQQRHEVDVEVVAQERVPQPAVPDALLGVPVVAPEGEGALRPGPVEGGVHDPLHPGAHGRVDHVGVQPQPVGVLGRRHHEQRRRPLERPPQPVRVVVAARRHLGPGQLRRPPRVPDHQALAHPPLGQPPGHPAPEPAGRPGDRDHPSSRHGRSLPEQGYNGGR